MDSTAVPKLIIIKGLTSQTYCITSSPVSIGRSLSNSFGITAEGVSRVHARVTKKGGDYYIADLGSTNGTFVNGERIREETKLHHHDTIHLGRTVALRFEWPAAVPDQVDPAEMVNISSELSPAIRSSIDSVEAADIPGLISTDEIPDDLGILRRAYQRLAILYEINSSVGSITNLDMLLGKVANAVLNLKKADRVAVLLADESTGQPSPAIIREKVPGSSPRRFEVSRTIVEKTLSGGVGILSSDALSDPRFNQSESIEVQKIRSVICAPLKLKGRPMGAVYVDCLSAFESFDEEDLKLLIAVCNEASIVIENVRSHVEVDDSDCSAEKEAKGEASD